MTETVLFLDAGIPTPPCPEGSAVTFVVDVDAVQFQIDPEHLARLGSPPLISATDGLARTYANCAGSSLSPDLESRVLINALYK